MNTALRACPILALVVLVAVAETRAQKDTVAYPREGDRVPAFTVRTLDGGSVSSVDRGKNILLVNFWATWCPPCREEIPLIEKEIWQKHRNARFTMVAISREEKEEVVRGFQRKTGFTFPVACDTTREIFRKFAGSGIPRSYVIDEKGKIVFASVGYTPEEFARMKNVITLELARLGGRAP